MINLDNCSEKELLEAEEAFRLLQVYVNYRLIAQAERLDGNIDEARVQELRMEAIYRQLPDWARW